MPGGFMSTSDYQNRKDIIHDLAVQIDDLLKDNIQFNLQLKLRDEEVARLKIEIVLMEDGRIELQAKLQDANDEVGRLGVVLHQQISDATQLK
jgi:hypothetical protein